MAANSGTYSTTVGLLYCRNIDALEGTGLQATGDGVWEDQILARFTACMEVLDPEHEELDASIE